MNEKERIDLKRDQVSKKLESLRAYSQGTEGVRSWVSYIRNALGMTMSDLAERVGLSQQTVSQAEKGEELGKITISQLKKMAEGLNCELVYSFVPKKPLHKILLDQAILKAKENLNWAKNQMELEGQSVEESKKRFDRAVEKELYSKYLWRSKVDIK